MSYRKSPWKLKVQWRGQKPQYFNDMIAGHFIHTMNKPGGFAFTVPSTERALDVLWGSKAFLEYRGETRFGGIINSSDGDEDKGYLTFQGVDWLGWLNQRIIDFQSANYSASPYNIQEVNSSEIVEELIKRYTGTSGTDSEFNNINIDHTGTSVIWNLLGRKLGEACTEIARSSKTTDGRVGYFMNILGDRSEIRMKPYGWKYYPQGLPLTNLKWSFDKTNLRNVISFRGGLPVPYPNPDESGGDMSVQSDMIELDIAANWHVEHFAYTSKEVTENDWAIVGDKSLWIDGFQFGGTPWRTNQIYWEGTDFDQDWSSPTYTGSDPTDYAAHIVSHISMWWWFEGYAGAITDQIQMHLRLINGPWTSNPTNMLKIWNITGDPGIYQTIDPAANQFMHRLVFDMDIVSIDEIGSFDWTAVDSIALCMDTGTPWDSTLNFYLDGLSIAFQEVDIVKTDTASPWEPAGERFEHRGYQTWDAAHEMASNILTRLKYPSFEATGNMPWYDPHLEVGDMVSQDISGKSIMAYVTSLDTVFSGDYVNTKVGLGRPRPSPKDIETAFGVILSGQSESGTGYKLAAPFTSSKCYRLCEAQCQLDCLTTACQTANQIGMNVADLCASTCQTFRQRDWFGDAMI